MAVELTNPVAERQSIRHRWINRIEPGGRVILADGDDDRAITAAGELAELGISSLLVGSGTGIRRSDTNSKMPGTVTVVPAAELGHSPAGALLAERCAELGAKRTAGWIHDPVFLSAAAVAAGMADAVVAGATRPTADVLRAGLRMIGTAPGCRAVTSSFLMSFSDGRNFGYGDCAVLPEPDADQLAEIAIATSRSFASLTGEEPRVAMLSFSTMGSAEHSSVGLVREATDLVRHRAPELAVDGELQFDAALIDSVARSKAPGSGVAGRANVFIFPNLAAGNIGYKITQRLAGAEAYGPILQGLAAPVNDLSRGCTSDDIVNVALISLLQAQSTLTGLQGSSA